MPLESSRPARGEECGSLFGRNSQPTSLGSHLPGNRLAAGKGPASGVPPGKELPFLSARPKAVTQTSLLPPVLNPPRVAAPPLISSVRDAKRRAPPTIFAVGGGRAGNGAAVDRQSALAARKSTPVSGADSQNAKAPDAVCRRKQTYPRSCDDEGSAGKDGAPLAHAPEGGKRPEQNNAKGGGRKLALNPVAVTGDVGRTGTHAPSAGMKKQEPPPHAAMDAKQGVPSSSLKEASARSSESSDVEMEGSGHYVDVDVKVEPVSSGGSSGNGSGGPKAVSGERSNSHSLVPVGPCEQEVHVKGSTGTGTQGTEQRLQDAAAARNKERKAREGHVRSPERAKRIKIAEHQAANAEAPKDGETEEAQAVSDAFAKRSSGKARPSGGAIFSKQSGKEQYQVSAAELAKQSRGSRLQGSAAAGGKQGKEPPRGPALVKAGPATKSKVRAQQHKRSTQQQKRPTKQQKSLTPSSPSESSPQSSSTSTGCSGLASSDSEGCSSDESGKVVKPRAPARRPSACGEKKKKSAEAADEPQEARHLLRDTFGRFAKKRRLVRRRDLDEGSKRRKLESPGRPESMPASSGARVKAAGAASADASDAEGAGILDTGRSAKKTAGVRSQPVPPVPRGRVSAKGDALSKCVALVSRSTEEEAPASSLTLARGSVGHKKLSAAGAKAVASRDKAGRGGVNSGTKQQRVRETSCDSVRSPEQPRVQGRNPRRRDAGGWSSEEENAKKKLKPAVDGARPGGSSLSLVF